MLFKLQSFYNIGFYLTDPRGNIGDFLAQMGRDLLVECFRLVLWEFILSIKLSSGI